MESILTTIGSFIGGGALVAVINGWFTRRRVDAESKKAEIEGSLLVTDSWKGYALQLHADMKTFKSEVATLYADQRDLRLKYIQLEEAHERLLIEHAQVKEKNEILTEQVKLLTLELAQYKKS